MTAHPDRAVFRSDFRPFVRMLAWPCALLFGLVAVGGAVELVRTGRLPKSPDFVLLLILPVGFFLAMALITYWACRYFTVEVSPSHLTGYDAFGRYHTVTWLEVRETELKWIGGIPLVYVTSRLLPRPLTLPVWLEDRQRFRELVEEYAGSNHPLTKMLQALAG